MRLQPTVPFWATQIVSYIEIQRRKVGARGGLFRCPADENAPNVYLNGPNAGEAVMERASGRRGEANGPQATAPAPWIEAVSYGGASDRYPIEWDGYDPRTGQSARWRTPKLAEIKQPSCGILLGEVFNHARTFVWHSWFQGSDDSFGEPGVDPREAWRHYGGVSPYRNGTNWLFADGHSQWFSVASFKQLYCCQEFPGRFRGSRSEQQERCGGGTTSPRR